MFGIALQTARARWTSFAGVFIAVALGVTLLTTTGLTLASSVGGDRKPVWYDTADVVVAGPNTITVQVEPGTEDEHSDTTATPRSQPLPAGLAAGLPGAIVDRWLPGGAHPWSAAALHGIPADSGPPSDSQVVVSGGAHRPGDRFALMGREFTVSRTVGGPEAVYLTDHAAEELSKGRIDAIAVRGMTAEQVRAAVGPGPRVLTGDKRAEAEVQGDADLLAVAASIMGTTAGVAAFVAVFVVAGTFAFAVQQRRRELALLRAAGATPRQVRRLVLGEAVVVGSIAGVVGCAAGLWAAPSFAHSMADNGFAPPGFTAGFVWWPLLAAFGTGLLVALAGAAVAARRAGRVRPIEALRDAAVETRVMTAGRWVFGLAFLGGTAAMLIWVPVRGPEGIALVLLDALLAITAVAMFAPLLAPGAAWLAGRLLPGVTAALARDGARTAVRRTASTVAPIFITVGIAASTLTVTATIWRAQTDAAAARLTATGVVVDPVGVPDGGVPVANGLVYVNADETPEQFNAVFSGPGLGRVMRLDAEPAEGTVVVGSGLAGAMHWQAGSTADFWLSDSTPVHLRVAGVLDPSVDLDDSLLLPWSLGPGYPDAVLLAAPAPEAAGTVLTPAGYFAGQESGQRRMNDLSLLTVLGMALLYTTIAIANTLVMATADRSRDLAVLRLAGTTPRQVLGMIGLEALLATAAGLILAAVVTGLMLLTMVPNLRTYGSSVTPAVPWDQVLGIAGVCAVVALVAALIPAALALRTPAARMAAIRE
ncbi:ABC transporter permease [Dactylosporangium matsuzakiense]|uniref:ABC transporter permease n=1 Tax=Dactylosporangium matsuzakiense TaxID=53360 RepID=A0A9W6NP73_9ACTN|nr:ABC transporter permease [Dactylosporangium matsuzakiense]UWZ42724.1 FtsX-like permease family protein [Dactylosporangium matsuzakiense]GLL03792.1 ABC transporter permease [Dactylosporangium matsuzakiense]